MLHTKIHRLKTKTFRLRAYKKDRMGSLQYEYEWNHGREKEQWNTPSNAVPNFSMEDKRDWPGNSDLNPIENI